jgi:hypothetical protein
LPRLGVAEVSFAVDAADKLSRVITPHLIAMIDQAPEVPGTPTRNAFWAVMASRIGIDKSVLLILAVLLFASAGVRLAAVLSTDVLLGQDADGAGYASLAHMIAIGELSQDDGSRTPGYPLMLALLGSQPERIRIAQTIMGLLTTGVLFVLAWSLSRRAVLAFYIGASYGLSLIQAFYEASLLTETLTAFLLSIFFLVLSKHVMRRTLCNPQQLVLIGLLAGLPSLVRPAFAIVPLVAAPAVVAHIKPKRLQLNYLVPALLPILIWSSFNEVRFGMFTPSTVLGFNLANHAGPYVEYASDKYSVIKEAYAEALPYYHGDSKRTNLLHQRVDCSSVNDGQPCTVQSKIRRITGQSLPEFSRMLTQMAIDIFSSHPEWYAASVTSAWTQFWAPPSWPEGLAYNPTVEWWFRRVSLVEKAIVLATNCAFLISVAVVGVYAALKRKLLLKSPVLQMAGTVLVASVSNAMLDPSEMSRYGTPLQPFAACVCAASILAIIDLARAKHGGRVTRFVLRRRELQI